MLYKFHESRRHKFPKARYRVTNWPEYDAALVRRGSLTLWFTEEAVAAWRAPVTGERGGQPIYSATAIETGLALRLVFRQPLKPRARCDRSPKCSSSISLSLSVTMNSGTPSALDRACANTLPPPYGAFTICAGQPSRWVSWKLLEREAPQPKRVAHEQARTLTEP